MKQLFLDRREAGRKLAGILAKVAPIPDAVVLALPRGGVPVGLEVARALGAPLDVVIVRKLGHPWQPELAMGAIASGGVRVMNPEVVAAGDISEADIAAVLARETRELERRERAYRGDRPPVPVQGRTVVLVDDGVATGSTMLAAVRALRSLGPASIIVAVPVAPADTLSRLRGEADAVACVATPEPFLGIGLWYQRFSQLSDAEVHELLDARAGEMARSARAPFDSANV
ncbi:MAG: phosphoribosyltransferase [Gemmatimonadota bacterium]